MEHKIINCLYCRQIIPQRPLRGEQKKENVNCSECENCKDGRVQTTQEVSVFFPMTAATGFRVQPNKS